MQRLKNSIRVPKKPPPPPPERGGAAADPPYRSCDRCDCWTGRSCWPVGALRLLAWNVTKPSLGRTDVWSHVHPTGSIHCAPIPALAGRSETGQREGRIR